MQDVAFFIQS
jgi:hypothetical protein